MKKALSYSVACRFEGMLRRVLHALAEEAWCGRAARHNKQQTTHTDEPTIFLTAPTLSRRYLYTRNTVKN